jgi:protein-serine/threonine kinase
VAASHSAALPLPSIHTHHHRDRSSDSFTLPSSSSTANALAFRQNHAAGPGLQIRTDLPSAFVHRKLSSSQQDRPDSYRSSHSAASPLLTPALRHNLSTSSLSPNSSLTSPALAAMLDITPLPSPIMLNDPNSPGPWTRIRSAHFDHSTTMRPPSRLASSPPTTSSLSHMAAPPGSPHKKKKGYGSLVHAAIDAQTTPNVDLVMRKQHSRNRSISDFVPEAMHNVRQRNVTVGPAGLHITTTPPNEQPMQREHYLAQQRGYVQPSASSDDERRAPGHSHSRTTSVMRASVDSAKVLPSPPPSNKSTMDVEDDEDTDMQSVGGAEDSDVEYFIVRSAHQDYKRKWRSVRTLGQGTFSKVVLATSQQLPSGTTYDEKHLDPRKLVAVKIVEHGPAGGADEERIEVSLKREVDILKSVSHPSIVQLKALEYTDERALLVLSYCPGGDLFELASEHRNILQPNMVQRMFAELVGAVRYLHQNYIVHRDIKLESKTPLVLCFCFLCLSSNRRLGRTRLRSPLETREPPNTSLPTNLPHRPRTLSPHPRSPSLTTPHNPLRQRRLRRPRDPPRPTLRRPQHRWLGPRRPPLRTHGRPFTLRLPTGQTRTLAPFASYSPCRLDVV